MDIANASILITGGTGSFGKKLVELLLEQEKARRIIVFSRDELKQHEMRMALPHPNLRFFLGDVRDLGRLERAFDGVDLVVHAAALKQVPACEYNPFEAVQTNVLGTQNVLNACIDAGVKRAMFISTDKAVSPVNLYGATKLCAEKLWTQGNAYAAGSKTRFACVRYGNVIGSRGSVIPLFREQAKTGRVTVTDERMTRFWITLDEVVRFVMSSLPLAAGGEVFVPKLPTMNIMDLVAAMAPDAKVEVTGIRPGEKIHETLISEDEARHGTELDDRFVLYPHSPSWNMGAPQGKALPEGFRYTSDTNPWKVGPEELKKRLI